MEKYRTSAGDTVDFIAWKFYNTQDGRVTEQVLAANPGLADYGAELPENLTVLLPEIDTTSSATGTRLWA